MAAAPRISVCAVRAAVINDEVDADLMRAYGLETVTAPAAVTASSATADAPRPRKKGHPLMRGRAQRAMAANHRRMLMLLGD